MSYFLFHHSIKSSAVVAMQRLFQANDALLSQYGTLFTKRCNVFT